VPDKTIVIGATVPETVKAFLINQANFYSEHGWYVHIVTSPGPEMPELRRTVAKWNRVTLHEIPMERAPSPLGDLRALVSWIRLLRKIRPQVVMTGTPKAALLGMLSSRVVRVRNRVYLVRGLRLETQRGFGARVGAIFERITCFASTNVLCVSESLQKAMVQGRLASSKKVQVFGHGSSNGVEIGRFHPPSENERSAARHQFGIDKNSAVVGFAGRLVPDKGLQEILSAIAIIQAHQPNALLLIAGNTDDGSISPEKIEMLSRDLPIVFAGRVENMVNFYHALDIFCLPSHREGMPNVNLEAASCGLPVVTTTATGCIDSVLPDRTGLVVAPRDHEALADSLMVLLGNSEKRTAFGLHGRSWIEKEFREEIVWEKQLNFIGSLVPRELGDLTNSLPLITRQAQKVKTKICFVVSAPMTAVVFLNSHIDYLSDDFEVTVVCNFDGIENKISKNAQLKNCQISREISPLADLKAVYSLTQFLKKGDFQIVHSVTPKAGLITAIAGWLAKIPIRIHWFTGQVWVLKSGIRRSFFKNFDRIIVRMNTSTLVDSVSQREFLIEQRIVTSTNSGVLGEGSIAGVNTKRFHPNPEMRAATRAELSILDPNRIVILFVGRLNHDKGLATLVKAFQSQPVQAIRPRPILMVVGPDEENYISQIRESLSEQLENFRYISFTNLPEKYMMASDIYCLPSLREGFGLSVIEASACELPVIATNIYGVRDAVKDGETGVLIAAGSETELASAIRDLATNPTARASMGRAGKIHAQRCFEASQVQKNLHDYYLGLL
jgi:glycosyltransferase involved in cell wall biosynthesis